MSRRRADRAGSKIHGLCRTINLDPPIDFSFRELRDLQERLTPVLWRALNSIKWAGWINFESRAEIARLV